MSDAFAALHAALMQAAQAAAGAPVMPVSVQFDWLKAPATADAIAIDRVTKSLVFLHGATAVEGGGALNAAGVFQIQRE